VEIVKKTEYFDIAQRRRGRGTIREAWITRVVAHPEHQRKQEDGRIRRWARIEEAGGRWLRVILLADGETVHNAFFDRGFKP
jgi:hypothetical protein